MIAYIYKVTNKVNGKSYIGQTTQTVEKRWKKHQSCVIHGKERGSPAFHRAILKYGVDNFVIDTLFVVFDRPSLDALEIESIKAFDTIQNGYNLHAGGYHPMPAASVAEATRKRNLLGVRPPVPTPEQRAAVGKANSERMKGKRPSQKSIDITSKPCVAAGVKYPSIYAASLGLNLSVKTVKSRIADARRPDYHWPGQEKQHSGAASTNTTVIYNGVTYVSLKSLCESMGFLTATIRQRLKTRGHCVSGVRYINLDTIGFDVFYDLTPPTLRRSGPKHP